MGCWWGPWPASPAGWPGWGQTSGTLRGCLLSVWGKASRCRLARWESPEAAVAASRKSRPDGRGLCSQRTQVQRRSDVGLREQIARGQGDAPERAVGAGREELAWPLLLTSSLGEDWRGVSHCCGTTQVRPHRCQLEAVGRWRDVPGSWRWHRQQGCCVLG
eukprot:2323558-Rhodomonas_salina.1